MEQVTLNVPDISCEHCERTVKNALGAKAGVSSVSVDIPAKKVRVDYDSSQINVDEMRSALEEEEYPVASVE